MTCRIESFLRQFRRQRGQNVHKGDHALNVLNVELGARSYPIHIEDGSLASLSPILQEMIDGRRLGRHHAVVVSDENVAAYYCEQVTCQLASSFSRIDTFVVPAGERSKSVIRLERLWQDLVACGTDRRSTVIGLGGGVVGDLAGFLAATFARGIAFVQIPTSLLAQVDSSVGGKVGINLPSAKNIVGAFWQPKIVVIDPNVLKTLDERNFASGMAEVIKYGVALDHAFFEFLESGAEKIRSRDPRTMTHMIRRCCELKAGVVIEDEEERSGRRAVLNYGHTFGHALEAVFGYGQFTHGEAISIGMNCAARLAVRIGMAKPELLTRQIALLKRFGLPVDCPPDRHSELIEAMKHDKKVQNGILMLVLPTKIGHVETVPSPGKRSLLESLNGE